MSVQSVKRRGRRPIAPVLVKRYSLGFRVTLETKQRLLAMAEASGRSMSQEAERLMELGIIFERILALASRDSVRGFDAEHPQGTA